MKHDESHAMQWTCSLQRTGSRQEAALQLQIPTATFSESADLQVDRHLHADARPIGPKTAEGEQPGRVHCSRSAAAACRLQATAAALAAAGPSGAAMKLLTVATLPATMTRCPNLLAQPAPAAATPLHWGGTNKTAPDACTSAKCPMNMPSWYQAAAAVASAWSTVG